MNKERLPFMERSEFILNVAKRYDMDVIVIETDLKQCDLSVDPERYAMIYSKKHREPVLIRQHIDAVTGYQILEEGYQCQLSMSVKGIYNKAHCVNESIAKGIEIQKASTREDDPVAPMDTKYGNKLGIKGHMYIKQNGIVWVAYVIKDSQDKLHIFKLQ